LYAKNRNLTGLLFRLPATAACFHEAFLNMQKYFTLVLHQLCMKTLLTAAVLLLYFFAPAQKSETFFDYRFKPDDRSPYYYVITEKKDSGWYREAWYVSQRSIAMQGWYKDEACRIAHGPVVWYHTTRFPSSKGFYVDDKKEGLWLGYDDEGHMTDSSTYKNDRRVGVAYHWYGNGFLHDSLIFDGQGNGVQVSWYDDGTPASGGRWKADTLKAGRWQYYDKKGNVMATEDYADGKLQVCRCYDENGNALDTALCRGKEAEPAGGAKGWQTYLQRGLQTMLEVKANSREWSPGQLTVVIRFVVENDGSLSEFKPLTHYGNGVEDAIISIFRQAPRWTPGRQFGRPVRSYHTQPVTFEIKRE